MRGIPIFTFVNKLDREGRPPLELLDEIEDVLGIAACPPSTGRSGMGNRFRGVYDLRREAGAPLRGREARPDEGLGPGDGAGRSVHRRSPRSAGLPGLPGRGRAAGRGGRDLRSRRRAPRGADAGVLRQRDDELRRRAVPGRIPGHGSAPGPRTAARGSIPPEDPRFTGFVFKIQANMDPRHRDRIAFVRVCSGRFRRGMKVRHARLGREIALPLPHAVPRPGTGSGRGGVPGGRGRASPTAAHFRIGDTLAEGRDISFEGVPHFSPEHFARVQLKTALEPSSSRRAWSSSARRAPSRCSANPWATGTPSWAR